MVFSILTIYFIDHSDFLSPESEICQLADIQESIQRMREGELVVQGEKQGVECRLSSSCPSLAVDSGAEGEAGAGTGGRRRGRGKGQRGARKVRGGRARSPSESTGESDEEEARAGEDQADGRRGGQHYHARGAEAVHPGIHDTTNLNNSLHKSISTPSMMQEQGKG